MISNKLYKLTFLIFVSLPIIGLSQTIDNPKYISLHLHTSINKDSVAGATGFIVKYHGRPYLVSNYHVFTNRKWNDTSVFQNEYNETPNTIEILFHNKDSKKVTRRKFSLYDPSGKRLFLTVPTNGGKQTLDIGLLPIKIPKEIKYSYINLDNIDTTWSIEVKTNLYIYGYPGWYGDSVYPKLIISKLEKRKTYKDFDPLIVSAYNDIEGASGSPVYMSMGRKMKFIGVYSGHGQADISSPQHSISIPSKGLMYLIHGYFGR